MGALVATVEWEREREEQVKGKEKKQRRGRAKFLSARNRIREWFMGLRRGRIHGVRSAFFIFLRPFLSFLRALLAVGARRVRGI